MLMRAPAGMISLHSGHEKEDEASGRTVSTQRAHSSWLPSQGMILGSRSPSSKGSRHTGHSRALIAAVVCRPRARSLEARAPPRESSSPWARARPASAPASSSWRRRFTIPRFEKRCDCMQIFHVLSSNLDHVKNFNTCKVCTCILKRVDPRILKRRPSAVLILIAQSSYDIVIPRDARTSPGPGTHRT